MINKLFLVFLTLFFLVGTVSAQDITIPYGISYDLKRACFNNGTFCSATATCNLTISYPNGNLLLDNQAMTRQSSYFNITLPAFDLNQLGVHRAIASCTDTGGDIAGNGDDTFDVTVTGDGNNFNIFPLQLTFLILGLILIVVGKTKEDLRMLKHIGSILMIVLGVITLWPGYSFINFSTLLGKTIGFSAIGLGFYFWVEDSFSRGKQTEYYEQEVEDDGRFHGN